MCGIAGKIYFDPRRPVAEAVVAAMTDKLAHRGPDARGLHVDGAVGLGHRRLSIIDLSAAANQPMVGPTGAVLTFNGEIYNFAELRAGLETRGRAFRTRSDTEVILALYEERGERCVDDLVGMFAFAVWDPGQRRLFCARDRLGKKPIYYYAGAATFAFASELQGLLEDGDVPRDVDWAAIHDYLTLHYLPSPGTIFRGVAKLPPAHTLTLDAESGRVALRRYWRPRFEPKEERDEGELGEELWALMMEATRARLVSDVPLGAFLSGGTDSSAVVAAMSRITGRQVKTFSIGFREAAYNELEDAARTARRYGTDHHELLVTPDAAAVLPELVAHHGEPFADPSSIPTYYLARLARQHVTVALSGDGGDEGFGGYSRYVWAALADTAGELVPAVIMRGAARALAWAGARANAPSWLSLAAQHAPALAASPDARFLAFEGHFAPWERAALYTGDFARLIAADGRRDTVAWFAAAADAAGARAPLDRYIQGDLDGYLGDGILAKVDIASMMHALEVRAPLLDHRVLELGARLPARLKQRGLQKRVLYKRAVAAHLPAEILRRKKRGLGIPLRDWLAGPLAPLCDDLVTGGRLAARGLFRPEALAALVAAHRTGRADHGHQLWNLMVLELWFRRFADSARVPAAAPETRTSTAPTRTA